MTYHLILCANFTNAKRQTKHRESAEALADEWVMGKNRTATIVTKDGLEWKPISYRANINGVITNLQYEHARD